MSASSPGWTIAGLVLAGPAAAVLAWRLRRGDGPCRWLLLATLAWGAAFAVQGAGLGAVTPAPIQLTLTDLLALVGLPPLGLAVFRLAGDARGAAPEARAADGGPAGRGAGSGRFADSFLLGLALFSVGWMVLLRHAYLATDVGPGSFAVDLIHPVADLILLAAALRAALRTDRRGQLPYLALIAMTVGDFVAVQARAGGDHPGTWPQLAWLGSIVLLGATGLMSPQTAPRPAAFARTGASRAPLATIIALTAAGVSGLVSLIFVGLTWGSSGPVPLLTAGLLILALIVRVRGLVGQAAKMAALARESDSQFHQLADRTSDVVLVCDPAGRISYASQAVARYGYSPAKLTRTRLPLLIHPDDLPAVVAAGAAVCSGAVPTSEGLACRVRSSDGTWRHVQATVSGYASGDRADLLLVTARDVSDQVALQQQVTHLTFHDGVTGLPNRSYLEERAKDVLARRSASAGAGGRIGAIFVDLDGFTAINDSAGHGAGDLVLAQAGRRLRGLVPAYETVARWGGDEFAVLIANADSAQEIVDLAERLAGAIAAEPFGVAGRDVAITASLGVAFDDPDEAEHLLRNADLAMSRAKDSGGGRVEVFAAHMHANVIRRLELAVGLRAAIAEQSLDVEYQPVVELATGRVAGLEALVRWSRDDEQVNPAEFLGIAEDSGLIAGVGSVVLAAACPAVAAWREAGHPVGLSVNFSLRQVSAAGFAESVLAALAESGLPPAALTIEVTERVLIEVAGPVLERLAALRQHGVRLAIDDFGTGYASLAYLRELPVDIIKIDPSFVAGLGIDGTLAMLTRTIVQVGHDLGIEIVAEGVERPEQLELLRAMGCGLGQGFLLASPMPAAGIAELLGIGESAPAGPGPGPGAGRGPEPSDLQPVADRPGPAAPAPAG